MKTNLVEGRAEEEITNGPCNTLDGVLFVEFLGNGIVDLLQGDLWEFVRLDHAGLVSNRARGMFSSFRTRC